MVLIKHAIKNAFMFSMKELQTFILVSIISGFLLTLRLWGTDVFDAAVGIFNFIEYTIIFMFLYMLFIAAQKFTGNMVGCESTYQMWKYGLPIAIFITFYSVLVAPSSEVWFLVFLYLGTVALKDVPRLRLGRTWPGVNVRDLMLIGVAGPLALLIFISAILAPLYFSTGANLFRVGIMVGSLIVFFSSIPLPNSNGMNVLIYSRKLWMFYFIFSLLTLFVIWSFQVFWFIIIFAISIGFVYIARALSRNYL